MFHTIAPTRGKCVPVEFLAGARPKVWISDRLAAQAKHAEAHQVCLAHLIRDAQHARCRRRLRLGDAGDTVFGPTFKCFLQKACAPTTLVGAVAVLASPTAPSPTTPVHCGAISIACSR